MVPFWINQFSQLVVLRVQTGVLDDLKEIVSIYKVTYFVKGNFVTFFF